MLKSFLDSALQLNVLAVNSISFCRPTELDALVFGHLFTIITTKLPDNRLAESVKSFDNLVQFCKQIDRQFFGQDFEVGDAKQSCSSKDLSI